MFCPNCGTNLADNARFCPSCGTPVGGTPVGGTAPMPAQQQAQQAASPQPPTSRGPQAPAGVPSPQGKKSSRPLIIAVVVLAVVVVGLLAAIGLGAFSPKQADTSSAPSSSSSQSTAESSSSASQSSSAGDAKSESSSASASSGASASTSSSAVSTQSSSEAKKEAVNTALDQGYQIFEGTLHVMTTKELADLQGVDPDMFTADGTYAVLVFDAPFQVSAMSGDGSGMRRQSASMLGVAEYTSYGSSVIGEGDIDYWTGLDGKHMTLAAMPEQTWFPSDVSLPVGEPSTSSATVVFVD